MTPGLHQASISLKKILQLDGELAASTGESAGRELFASQAPLQIDLRGVCHAYPAATGDGQFMLGPLDLTIREGECVYIVGGNGSGKTTLALLLLGLYEPEAGPMVLNGKATCMPTASTFRQCLPISTCSSSCSRPSKRT